MVADNGQLVTEVTVECFEVSRKRDGCSALRIGGGITAEHVQHIGTLDCDLVKIQVGGIERVVYLRIEHG